MRISWTASLKNSCRGTRDNESFELRKNAEISTDTQNKIDSAMEMLAHENFQVEVFDNVIVRKLIDCVKVLSKEKLLIVFKGGVEVKAQMEK